MAKLVPKTYGDALFDLALENGKMDILVEETGAIMDILKENEELRKLMMHPKITKEEKINVLEAIFKGRVSDDMVGFLRIILIKDRYGEIIEIFEYFISRVKEYKNIGTAYVTTAVEMKEKQKEKLLAKLIKITGYEQIDMEYRTDETIIGGMIIRIGDRVIDSSIKTRIHEISNNLSKIQL